MRIWQGERVDGEPFVTMNGIPFDAALSLKIRNHSPDGFNWGYGGSGPAQLALAILLELVPVWQAEQLYQRFKAEVIAGLDKEMWIQTQPAVEAWIARNVHRLKPEYVELPELPDDVVEVIEPGDPMGGVP